MPGLVFESIHPPMSATHDITRITWNDRTLFPPPDDRPDIDHIERGYSGELRVAGEWYADGLHRWVLTAPGIDDCSEYGAWVLDVRGGRARLRRIVSMCIQGSPGVQVLAWKPRPQILISTVQWRRGELVPVRLAFDIDE